MTGSRVGGYRLHESIHKGGFAHAYFATSPADQPVVFRILRKHNIPNLAARRRFLHGTSILQSLNHPNIVRVLDRRDHALRPFVVLEFVEGKNLNHWRGGRDPFWLTRRFHIVYLLAKALDYLRGQRVLHLDIKPENVLLGYRGEVKLIDFDLACREPEIARCWNRPAGTPAYLPPELLGGKLPSPASDLYQFGLVIREIFPEGSNLSGLDAFAAACIEPNPAHRPQNLQPIFDTILTDNSPDPDPAPPPHSPAQPTHAHA